MNYRCEKDLRSCEALTDKAQKKFWGSNGIRTRLYQYTSRHELYVFSGNFGQKLISLWKDISCLYWKEMELDWLTFVAVCKHFRSLSRKLFKLSSEQGINTLTNLIEY